MSTVKDVLKGWLIPPKIYKKVSSLKRGLIKKEIEENDDYSFFKGNFKRRCFIVASGPSILKQDLKLLKDEYVIAVSHAHKHKDISLISPKYHVLAPFHHPFTFDDAKKYFDDFQKVYDANKTEIYLGHRTYKYSFKNFLERFPKYNSFQYNYIDYSNSSQLDELNVGLSSTWDIGKKPFECRTVIYSAILLAVNKGFKKIYLLGCDHDYLYSKKRLEGNRFYSDKDGIDDKIHLEAFDSERWYFEYYMRWKQYRLMRDHLSKYGIEIINATEGGHLDVFPRVKYESLF